MVAKRAAAKPFAAPPPPPDSAADSSAAAPVGVTDPPGVTEAPDVPRPGRSTDTPFDLPPAFPPAREEPPEPPPPPANPPPASSAPPPPPGPESDLADRDAPDFDDDDPTTPGDAGGSSPPPKRKRTAKAEARDEERAQKEEDLLTEAARGFAKSIAGFDRELIRLALKRRTDPAEYEELLAERELDPSVEAMHTFVIRGWLKDHPAFASSGISLGFMLATYYGPRLGETAMAFFDSMELTEKERTALKLKWKDHWARKAEQREEKEANITGLAVTSKRGA